MNKRKAGNTKKQEKEIKHLNVKTETQRDFKEKRTGENFIIKKNMKSIKKGKEMIK